MATAKETSKLADIPKAKPGFDALGMSAPVLVQINPNGKWETCSPEHFDEEQIKAVVQYLVKSQALSTTQSHCCQCAGESWKGETVRSNYVPVIMMPIYPSEQCPFDIDCEAQKMKQMHSKRTVKKKAKTNEMTEFDDEKKKSKKRGFVLQRFTDFDLLSQW